MNSPAPQPYHVGGGGGGGVFQFSDAHIGMARADKDTSGLALSNNPHQSPMPLAPQHHVTSTPAQSQQQQQQQRRLPVSSDAMLSAIGYGADSSDMMHDSAFDSVSAAAAAGGAMDDSLLGVGTSGGSGNDGADSAAFDLFDSDGQYSMENQLSPQAFADSGNGFNLGQYAIYGLCVTFSCVAPIDNVNLFITDLFCIH